MQLEVLPAAFFFSSMNISRIFKIVFFFIISAALVSGGYLLLNESNKSTPATDRPAAGARLLISMEGFRLTQSENGRPVWHMRAVKADLYDNKEALLKDVDAVFENPGGRRAELTGEAGAVDIARGNASVHRISKDVKIVTSDDYVLTTNSLLWLAEEKRFQTPDPFILAGDGIYLEGVGFSADSELRSIAVKDHVKAVLQD
jgi:LPS export ABC transporter protein LptC